MNAGSFILWHSLDQAGQALAIEPHLGEGLVAAEHVLRWRGWAPVLGPIRAHDQEVCRGALAGTVQGEDGAHRGRGDNLAATMRFKPSAQVAEHDARVRDHHHLVVPGRRVDGDHVGLARRRRESSRNVTGGRHGLEGALALAPDLA